MLHTCILLAYRFCGVFMLVVALHGMAETALSCRDMLVAAHAIWNGGRIAPN